MKYLTSKDYPSSCDNCKRSIDDAHELIVMGAVSEEYVIDPERPIDVGLRQEMVMR